MIIRRTGLYKSYIKAQEDEWGFTLVEMLAVLMILAILASVAIPSMAGYAEDAKKKSYITEAYVVRGAVQTYIIEKSSTGGLSDLDIYEDLIIPKLEEEGNAICDVLAGSCSKGAELVGVGYNGRTKEVTDLIYRAGAYEIEIKGESDVEVRVRK